MTFEKDTVVLEKNVRLARILAAVFAVTLLAAFGFIFVGGAPNLFALAVLPAGLWARIGAENWRARRRNARVRAGDEGVFVDGVCVAPPARIAHGLVQPRPGRKPTVRLRDKKQSVVFETEVDDEAEGLAFLRAIHHDAAAKKATFRTLSPFMATRARTFLSAVGGAALVVTLLLAGITLATRFGNVMPAVTTLLALASMLAMSRRRMVEVGADGLSSTWLGRRRYVSFDDVASVAADEIDSVVVVLRSGEKIPLRTGGSSGWDGGERAALLRDALLRRILEAMEAHRGRVGPRELAAQLAPGARDENAWLSDLRKLREGEGGYRAAAVRDEDLWRVVEDPGAPEEARAAAAVLLRKTDGAQPRLRIAADAVASPRLRVALEAEEEEQAEEALKAFVRRSG